MGVEIPILGLPLLPVAAVLGALIGSFLNVVIARLPEGESIAYPGSRCPRCHTAIPWYLNIPMVSWAVLRGRCRSCRAPISIRYPVIEALTAIVFVAAAVRFGPTWATPVAWLFVGSLIVITFIDIDIWEIPDEISIPGAILGCILRPLVFDAPWWSGLVGASLGGLALWGVRWFYLHFRGIEGMGLGDVKLIAMIGAFLGVSGLLPVILVASIAGTLIGGILLLVAPRSELEENGAPEAEPPKDPPAPEAPLETPVPGRSPTEAPERTEEADAAGDEDEEDWTPPANAVPFGPFLALGALTELLLGPQIDWLLFRFGL